jgi:hypothetical protein
VDVVAMSLLPKSTPITLGVFPVGSVGRFNTDIDVVVAVFSFVEGSRCWGLPFEQCQLVVTNTQLELNPTTHQGNANRLQLLNVLKSPHIQINGCRSKLVDLLNSFALPITRRIAWQTWLAFNPVASRTGL